MNTTATWLICFRIREDSTRIDINRETMTSDTNVRAMTIRQNYRRPTINEQDTIGTGAETRACGLDNLRATLHQRGHLGLRKSLGEHAKGRRKTPNRPFVTSTTPPKRHVLTPLSVQRSLDLQHIYQLSIAAWATNQANCEPPGIIISLSGHKDRLIKISLSGHKDRLIKGTLSYSLRGCSCGIPSVQLPLTAPQLRR